MLPKIDSFPFAVPRNMTSFMINPIALEKNEEQTQFSSINLKRIKWTPEGR
jgi:hypothetical protein